MLRLAVLLGGIAVATAAHAAPAGRRAQAPVNCACPSPLDPAAPAGVAWQGAAAPDLPAIAALLAPVLWYSSDEPLIVLRDGQPIPQPHPSDRPATSAVVYYQATDFVLRGEERVSGTGDEDPRFFDKVDHFVLKYFFYYDEDRGLSPHAHDLEAISVLVRLERADGGCYRIRVPRVDGHAHGLDWYANSLRVERDTVFPLTVLVEEGKHASAPDRNGDGVYTPGYDVNIRVNDAWGLRDVLGSSVLFGAGFSASMAKPRDDAFRLLPPTDAPVCGQRRLSRATPAPGLGRYELRSAYTVPEAVPAIAERRRLLDMMRFHQFGPAWPPDQHDSDVARELSDPENLFTWISAINARVDSRRFGASVQGPGLDLREVWLVPRLLVNRGWAVEALVTPSASRWADWYVAAGYERGLTPPDAAGADGPSRNGFAGEVGLKLRVNVSGRARWAALGYRFAGVRMGVRANGFARLRQPRLILEIGAGAF